MRGYHVKIQYPLQSPVGCVEALLRILKRCWNLDTFRTSGRRLRAGSDDDVTDVSAMTDVSAVTAVSTVTAVTTMTTVTAMTAVTLRVRHELQHVTWDSFYRSPQKGPKGSINIHS